MTTERKNEIGMFFKEEGKGLISIFICIADG